VQVACRTPGTLATFGKPFGLELYRSSKATPAKPLLSPSIPVPADARVGLHPDDTKPIPRPSRYYGRRQNQLSEHFRSKRQPTEAPTAPPPGADAITAKFAPARSMVVN
jgi:hypothetical protein